MYAAGLRATHCLGCGDPMSFGGRIDRRYCRPACRTLAYRRRLRTRRIEHGPTAVPRWAIGRLPELSIALTTLGRVQGNVTVLARQMECEEASVRAWLLRLRELGDRTPDVPPPEPEIRLRTEADRRLADLDEALTQRNELDEDLRAHKAQAAAEITKLRKELESMRQQFDERAELLTKMADETVSLKAEEAHARQKTKELQAQYSREQAAHSGLKQELSAIKNDAQSIAKKLKAVEQERTALLDGKAQVERELAVLREAAKQPARALAQRVQPAEGAQRRQHHAAEEARPTTSKAPSAAAIAARERMDEQVARITHTVCLAFLAQAKEAGRGEPIHLWLSQHSTKIHQAAQLLARVTLTARMGQDKPTSIAEAAQSAYVQTVECHCSDGQSDVTGFSRWFQDSTNKDFLLVLATAIILALDARSSTDTGPASQVQPAHSSSQPSRTKPQRPAVVPHAASSLVEPSQAPRPIHMEPQMPRVNRNDALVSLMRDKVQLLHMLAEYQEERLEEVTGQLLEPFNEATLAAAARQAAHAARREYYFRPHGLSLAAAQLDWVIEGELLDPRSEEVLFGEVLDQIERLKVAVEKVKPKRKPW